MPNLSGEDMQYWIQRPKMLQLALNLLQSRIPQWKVWKTIKLGVPELKTEDDFWQAFEVAGIAVTSGFAQGMLSKVKTGPKTEVDLVRVTVEELGFNEGVSERQIYDRAVELGLVLCPFEVGPQLRLQYPEQPNGECLLVSKSRAEKGMRFLPGVFSVDKLLGNPALSDAHTHDKLGHWHLSSEWVFVLPRK